MADPLTSVPAPATPRRSRLTLYFTFSLSMLAAAFLLIIPTGLIGVAFILGGLMFFGVICLHYLIWGRWMDRVLREEQLEESD